MPKNATSLKSCKCNKIRKLPEFRSRNLFACGHINAKGKVVVTITDRGPWQEAGSKIPADSELIKLRAWFGKARVYSQAVARTKV